jgi:hypothetical protein
MVQGTRLRAPEPLDFGTRRRAREHARLLEEIARQLANNHQDDGQDNRADQAGQKDRPAGRRVEDDLASPRLFGGIRFLVHETPPARQKSGSEIVPR